tara:strand:+ start:2467 stop:3078 length:612 start_codon:yes stop_codon:yes gene_type:complete
MEERNVNINNFIGVYDNYITKQQCDMAIKLYQEQDNFKKTFSRISTEDQSILQKQDQQYFAHGGNIEVWWKSLDTLLANFYTAWQHYLKNTGADGAYDSVGKNPFHYSSVKIQKTLPTEGYHIWHIEHNRGFENESRAFVYSIFLNDVEEGGETEFLHFSKRVKPKTGRIVIWPAGFPYLHRGNPPLSGEKYLLTSWMTLKPT